MHLGLKADGLLETALFMTGLMPEKSLLPFFATVVSQAITSAQRLGIFDLLNEDNSVWWTSKEVAKKVQADEHGVQVLMESLVAFGYLQRKNTKKDNNNNNNDDNTECTFQMDTGYLKQLQDPNNKSFADFGADVAKRFESLEGMVKSGQVENFHFSPPTENCLTNYHNFLKGYSPDPVKDMIGRVKFVSSPQKMLDVAGGPAQYSIAFCQKYPQLKSTILDLPAAKEIGQKEIHNAQLGDRIHYRVGNFLEMEWNNDDDDDDSSIGIDYDFALLSHILHALKPQECQVLLSRTFQVLKASAIIVINEPYFPGPNDDIDTMSGWSSLLYFATCGARTHPTPTIEKWLMETGFVDIKVSRFRSSAITIAKKPSL